MNRKYLLLFFFTLLNACNVLPKELNPFDPKTDQNLFLNLLLLSNEFSCSQTPKEPVGSLNEVIIDCNQGIATEFISDITKNNQTTFKNFDADILAENKILFRFDPLILDAKYTLNLDGLVSINGEKLQQSKYHFVVDNEIPILTFEDYAPLSDYSVFSKKYWEFVSNEDLENIVLPSLEGTLASAFYLRNIQVVNKRTFRVFFETTFLNNNPGYLTISFPGLSDTAGNLVNQTTTIQVIGLIDGPSIQYGRSQFYPILTQSEEVVLIYGGSDSIEVLKNGSNLFKLTANNLPHLGDGESSVLLNDGSILVTGGFIYPAPLSLNQTYLYYPDSESFLPANSMLRGRSQHTTTRLLDGRVLVAGGTNSLIWPPSPDGSIFMMDNSAELYDPNDNTFYLSNSSMMARRSFHCSVLLDDGKVMLIGGTTGNYAPLDTTEFYDPVTDSFEWGPSLPVPLAALHCFKLSDGNVIMYAAQISNLNNSIFKFDVSKNQIFTIANSSIKREWAVAAELTDGGILFHGGGYKLGTHEASRLIEKLDYGRSNSLLSLGSDRNSISRHGVVKFSNGTLMFLGGFSNGILHHGTQYYGSISNAP
ncbi:kelch repeat-containing protein [Leptospira sp. 96542]|nr:kelch repeat-containing protein [Leptospira sp. 96542]